jgi:hypothetical protein
MIRFVSFFISFDAHVSLGRSIKLMDHVPLVVDFVSRLRTTRTLNNGLQVDLKCFVTSHQQDTLLAVRALASLFRPSQESDTSLVILRSARLAYVAEYPNAYYVFQGWEDPSMGVKTPTPFVQLTMVCSDLAVRSRDHISPLTVSIANSLPVTDIEALHVECLNPIGMEEWQSILRKFSGVHTLTAFESPAAKLTAVLLDDAIEAAACEIRVPLMPNLERYEVDQAALHAVYTCSFTKRTLGDDLVAFLRARSDSNWPIKRMTLGRMRSQDMEIQGKMEEAGVQVEWSPDTLEACASRRFHERRLAASREARERWGTDEEEFGF